DLKFFVFQLLFLFCCFQLLKSVLDIGIRYSTLEGFFIKELSSGIFCVNMISDVLKFFDLFKYLKSLLNLFSLSNTLPSMLAL
ncbi:hypothetical protein LRB78_04325, partial [Borreliella americana]|uniref:hypothetical protein n=1 Tax=Borreliella americana TaxID=478807 RepID=UPI001E4637D9